MVNLVKHDLEFILKQIKIAEANSDAHSGDGTPLNEIYVDADGNVVDEGTPGATLAISHPLLPYGLRTVDGSFNNLTPGQEGWGAADNPFVRLTDPVYRNVTGRSEVQTIKDITPAEGATYTLKVGSVTLTGTLATGVEPTIQNLAAALQAGATASTPFTVSSSADGANLVVTWKSVGNITTVASLQETTSSGAAPIEASTLNEGADGTPEVQTIGGISLMAGATYTLTVGGVTLTGVLPEGETPTLQSLVDALQQDGASASAPFTVTLSEDGTSLVLVGSAPGDIGANAELVTTPGAPEPITASTLVNGTSTLPEVQTIGGISLMAGATYTLTVGGVTLTGVLPEGATPTLQSLVDALQQDGASASAPFTVTLSEDGTSLVLVGNAPGDIGAAAQLATAPHPLAPVSALTVTDGTSGVPEVQTIGGITPTEGTTYTLTVGDVSLTGTLVEGVTPTIQSLAAALQQAGTAASAPFTVSASDDGTGLVLTWNSVGNIAAVAKLQQGTTTLHEGTTTSVDGTGASINFGGGIVLSDGNYGQMGPDMSGVGGGTLADADPRIISNLIVDQTLKNPAAIYAGLAFDGVSGAAFTQAMNAINAAFKPFDDAMKAEAAAKVAEYAAARAPGNQAAQEQAATARANAITKANEAKDLLDELIEVLKDNGLEMSSDLSLINTATTSSLDVVKAVTTNSVLIPNVSPDIGDSAPYNSWFTLFGQFFDHGLDLVPKGGNGTVYIPLQPDDPLYVPGSHTNFMVLTRAPVNPDNLTTPFVDQNQTYGSNASKQLFMREYELSDDGRPFATGNLLEGHVGGKPGLATWADVKAQAAEKLGIQLTDADIGNIPLFAVDAYGEFIRGANGFPQVVVAIGPGGVPILAEGDPENPVNPSAVTFDHDIQVMGSGGSLITITAGTAIPALRTGHAFLDDIAHFAVPFGDHDHNPATPPQALQPDSDSVAGGAPGTGFYDNELLDAHYITGDGRGNENIGLTAVHHVFHSEHNHLVQQVKEKAIASGDLAFLNEWLRAPLPAGTALPTDAAAIKALADGLAWDGERLFQAARFVNEMEYQHLVFEEFARKVQPDIDAFVFNPSTDINPAIFAEFAHVVYRFGHSMLNETVDRINADGSSADLDLFDAFLNPLAFGSDGVSHAQAAGAIVRGMTGQHGNEIDEFVTNVLRNNLLGIPLDLPALNIARGRDTGMPSLNEARAQFKAIANGDTKLDPYTSWADFAQNLKNPASIVNFIAAYGTHSSITSATTVDAKRDAAMKIVFGGEGAPADRLDFLNARNGYAGGKLGGLNDVDLWVGGLAEKRMDFGGMLGSTFTFVFELQLENLQNGDRFYYLSRVQGLNLLTELENNSFAKMVLNNTDLGETGYAVPGDIFSRPDVVLYTDTEAMDRFDLDDPLQDDPYLQVIQPMVVRVDSNNDGISEYIRYNGGAHVVIQGTDVAEHIVAGDGDDSIWGRGGDDRLEGGYGVEHIHGGTGDDIITNSGTDIGAMDFLHGEEGNDVIHGGNGLALIFGNQGQDFIVTGPDGKESFGGLDNDFMLGGEGGDFLLGGEGDDWIEAGNGFDTTAGDNSELFFNSSIQGHDVMFAGQNEHDFDAESGDDIMVQGESVMRNEGMFGFDWVTHKGSRLAADIDLGRPIFTTDQQDILRNRFDQVEGASGWDHNDVIIGDNRAGGLPEDEGEGEVPGGNPTPPGQNETTLHMHELTKEGIERIAGLTELVTGSNAPVADDFLWAGGNILIGGGGNDTIEGRGGDDVIDGDMWLNVRIAVMDSAGNTIATADGMTAKLYLTDANGMATDVLYRPASVSAVNFTGMSLVEATFNRHINPGQLKIVRELVNGNREGDVDTVVYSGNRSDYVITREGPDSLRIVDTRDINPNGLDTSSVGDIVRRIEKLQFADGTVDVGVLLDQPFEVLHITYTAEGVLSVSHPPSNRISGYVWEVLGENGVWAAVGAGATFTPGNTYAGVEVRAVALYDDKFIVSAETAFVGTAGEDGIDGSTGANIVVGLASDDILTGDAGIDIIDGGAGDDRLDGGDGNDTLFGRGGNDILRGRTGDNLLDGGAGDDDLFGGHGNDTFEGGNGVDAVTMGDPLEVYDFVRVGDEIIVTDSLGVDGSGRDVLRNIELVRIDETDFTLSLVATEGDEILVGTADADTINGLGGNDLIFASAGNDTLLGGAGADTLIGGAGADSLSGGTGGDTYLVDEAGDQVVEAAGQGTDTVRTTLAAYVLGDNVENLEVYLPAAGDEAAPVGGTTPFSGTGNALNNAITGGFGNDVLSGLGGNDTLNGGAGADQMLGGLGSDTYLVDNAGDQVVEDAGAGIDTVQTTLAAHTLADNVENLTFVGSGSFTGTGNGLNNALTGSFGTDTLNGGAGADTLNGGQGADVLNGGGGTADVAVLTGPIGSYSFARSGNAIIVTDSRGAQGDGVDTLTGIEQLQVGGSLVNLGADGTAGADVVVGSANADTVNGQAGDDLILGLAGNDTLNGGNGGDTISGGEGDDTIRGQGGQDVINGGAGDDTIVWNINNGRDLVDGGANGTAGDTFIVNGDATAETFTIYTRAAFLEERPGAALATGTEIVITRGIAIIAELDNIEEIQVNTIDPLLVSSPGGQTGGTSEGDTIQVVGDFTQTSLNFNTIRVNGEAGSDTIDITSLQSAHRIVFRSNGGNDIIVGALRPQDVIELAPGTTLAEYTEVDNGDGTKTLSNGTHSVTFASSCSPVINDGQDNDDDQGNGNGNDDDHCGDPDDDEDDDNAGGDDDDDVGTPTPQPDPVIGAPIVGTAGNNVLLGTAKSETILGLEGNDNAMGGAGADVLNGGSGDDFLSGEDGRDVMFGGDGNDNMLGGSASDMLYGEAGADRVFGDDGNDLIDAGSGNDTVYGGAGDDIIVVTAGDGNDTYYGDDMAGGMGADTLDMSAITTAITANLGTGHLGSGSVVSSQSGSDTIWGVENIVTGSGNDTITASRAVNVIDGGAGSDVFRFLSAADANGDTILGFQPGDRLDLSAIDANGGMGGRQSFTLANGSSFTGPAQLVITHETRDDGDYTVVSGNTIGSDAAEFRISIKGTHSLQASDFTLS